MKSISKKVMKNRISEMIESTLKPLDEDIKENANHVAQTMIALLMFLMNTHWKCKKSTCQKRFNEICDFIELGEVFGQSISDYDYIKYCSEELDIDVSKIKLETKIISIK